MLEDWDKIRAFDIGFIYLAKCGGLYKLGKTTNVDLRLASLRTDNANPVDLIWFRRVHDLSELERKLHEALYNNGWGYRNEWYDLKDLRVITQLLDLANEHLSEGKPKLKEAKLWYLFEPENYKELRKQIKSLLYAYNRSLKDVGHTGEKAVAKTEEIVDKILQCFWS